MNRKQREKNRRTAATLRHIGHICKNCGERGGHWVSYGLSIEEIMGGATEDRGFWTCAKMYGPDGRRIDMSDSPFPSLGAIVRAAAELSKGEAAP